MSPSSFMSIISYPIPAYSNVPIKPQYYQPKRFVISSITQGKTTIVTATTAMDFVIGQLVRLIIPPTYGIRDLNEQQAYVIDLPSSTQVTLDIDSSSMTSYVSGSGIVKPQILAIGDINTGYQSNSGSIILTQNGNTNINIPGSFINISPQ